jgi:hypothetical protein
MERIDELLAPIGISLHDAQFQLSGTAGTMSQLEAAAWLLESNAEGFSRIRFIVQRAKRGSVLIELAAATPGNP